jgi:hypothetical protein
MLSSEAIQAVHSLKLARSSAPKLQQVFNARLTRLLKADLFDTLAELQRQNHLDLALQVFWMEKVLGLVAGKIMKAKLKLRFQDSIAMTKSVEHILSYVCPCI